MSVKAGKHARELLLKEYRGVLSTHSKAMPGFPFGSVVPYCLDAEGYPLILISRIAQHTHNLGQDAKCSLLVGERGAEDVQAVGRLTLLAEARQLCDEAESDAAALRYYRFFPQSRDYHRTHDFDFWRLQPVRWRFIGGFGAIHWLDRVALANPFVADQAEQGMFEAHESGPRRRDRPLRRAGRLAEPGAGADGRHRQRGLPPAHRPEPALAGVPNILQHSRRGASGLGGPGSRRGLADRRRCFGLN